MPNAKEESRFPHWVRVFLTLFVFATMGKALMNAVSDNFKGLQEHHSYSATEARSKGTLVCELEHDGPLPMIGGQPLDIRGAWVEDRHLACHILVWFPGVRRLGGQNVCLLVGTGQERQFSPAEPLREGDSWSSGGQTVILFRIDRWEGQPVAIGVSNGFRQPVAGEDRLKPRQ